MKSNYKESLKSIKAGLFDIYEEQEKIIELETNEEEKQNKANSFINIKNIALNLIDEIEKLYEEKDLEDDKENYSTSEDNIDDLKKYYLNCDFNRINFAYVPKSIYEKIKKNKEVLINREEDYNDDDFEEENDIDENMIDQSNDDVVEDSDLTLYKEDSENPRGIIVRNDQYMKLALSKHRQKGVLVEAKEYRKQEVARKQREEQKKELEKAELKFNI